MKQTVECKLCGRSYKRITAGHLGQHRITMAEYREMFPDAKVVSEDQCLGQTEMLKLYHKWGTFLSEEGRQTISQKLKQRHTDGKMPHGKTHWSYGKLKFKGKWIPQEEVRSVLEELVEQDMILLQMAEECQVDSKTITNWLKRFDLQQGMRKGSRCSWYKGGWIKERGPDWLTLRTQILERDGYKCRECGMTQEQARARKHALSVHHIVPWRETHDNSPENLLTLCQSHHMKIEWQSGCWA